LGCQKVPPDERAKLPWFPSRTALVGLEVAVQPEGDFVDCSPSEVVMARALNRAMRRALPEVLLACGIGYGAAYIIANDLIAATIFDGYSRIDQAISELSGTGASSRGFLNAMLPLFTLLVLGFGIGVWQSAGRSLALRVTGGILIAQALMFPLWLLFPMTSRDEMMQATSHTNDIGHLVLSATAVLFIVAEMAFSAAALGKRFRYFSIAMMITTVAAGGYVASTTSEVGTGEPTPWMGAVERVSYGSWLLWMVVLAIVLLRLNAHGDAARTPAADADGTAGSPRPHSDPIWHETADAKVAAVEAVDRGDCFVGKNLVFGAALGIIVGLLAAGGVGIALGSAAGAGAGVVVAAVVDMWRARRRYC
jgi:hypothetical protein